MRFCVPLLVLLSAGCSPAIYSFAALPNESCPDSPVVLSWHASNAGEISSKPAGFSYATPSPEGSTTTPTPKVTTRYHLEVHNLWGSAARDADVTVPTGSVVPI